VTLREKALSGCEIGFEPLEWSHTPRVASGPRARRGPVPPRVWTNVVRVWTAARHYPSPYSWRTQGCHIAKQRQACSPLGQGPVLARG
jgi:hypothetical protein